VLVRQRWDKQKRLTQIVDHATTLIGRSGYHGFSVQEVAESCGLSMAGLLHHIGSKENLLIMVLQERDRRDGENVSLRQPLQDTPLTVDDYVDMLHAVVERNALQPEIIRLYTILRAESIDENHPAHAYFDERDQMALTMFEQAAAGITPDARSLARQLLALMGGLEEQWLREQDSMDLVAEWDKGIRALLQGHGVSI
jgi:AcrR family transcriptional regulator